MTDHADTIPTVPDYPRLRAEVERGAYPFEPGDEGELFARCEWLEAQNVSLVAERQQAIDALWLLRTECVGAGDSLLVDRLDHIIRSLGEQP